jgi:uncharacterized protein YkwD
MFRLSALLLTATLVLGACARPPQPLFGWGQMDARRRWCIESAPADAPRVRQRMQDGINTLRGQNGLPPLQANAQLASAAATHAQDMSFQSRPWHWGSDGSSPMLRAQRAGYQGVLIGELISETFENEFETVNAWMVEPETRQVILDRRANEIGVGWFQDPNGKLWWTVVLGQAAQPMFLAGR